MLNWLPALPFCPLLCTSKLHPRSGSCFAPPIGVGLRFAFDHSSFSPTSRLGTLLLPIGFAFSLLLVACCRGDLRVSVSPSASLLASRFGSLSFSQLSFLAFWFCLLFFLPNQSSVLVLRLAILLTKSIISISVCYSSYFTINHHLVNQKVNRHF